MWRYRDFLAVSEDFTPVFSEDVDRSHKGNWKFFIPHGPMKNLLEKLIVALERGHGSDRRSIWLTGAYGTGKTYASFVIKHLLEDPLDEVEDYFQRHQQTLSVLWPRFRALRGDGRYEVVYRSSSGHITSSRRLMIEIQQAIRDHLRMQGHATSFGESITDQLLKKLMDSSGVFSWEAAFEKYRGRFRTAATAADVLESLRRGDGRTAEEVAAVLEEEGFALLDSPTEIKTWIRDVIDRNGLRGIVFIWDEFTEFFANNVPVTPLQELAQATADMPFYLFLVTHRALNQFTRVDDDTRKKLLDRFHSCYLEMTPVTAYELIANVIDAVPGRREEWEAKRDSLWDSVGRLATHINVLGERVPTEDLKALVPIHPLTAYLLATIASLYSSSQRTLFQFLMTNEPGSFQWFIDSHPEGDWYWLTPDYLWQYFFEESKIESLDAVADILAHYRTHAERLTGDEKRVLRVMLLLTALWRQTQGVLSLVKPSLSRIKRMFMGTALYESAEEVAARLCDAGVMLAVPSGNDCDYVLPTATVDHAKLREYRQKAETTLTFEKAISSDRPDDEFAFHVRDLLTLQGAAKLRHPLRVASAKDLKLRRERLVEVEKAYEIGVTFVVAQDDEHLAQSEAIAAEITKDRSDCCILISQVALGARRWNEWLDWRARSWCYEDMRDLNAKRYPDAKAKTMADEWLSAIRSGRIRAFFRGRQIELSGCGAIADYLQDIVEDVFPYGPETLSSVGTLYAGSWGQVGAEIGLNVARGAQRPYRDVVETLKNQDVWEDGRLDHHTDHPLAKMSKVVEGFFFSRDHVNLKELWEALQEPPFGLMPSPIGVLLFAVLMRRYSHGYYYSDGANALPLNPNKLAELIEQVMKGARQSENYTIRKMSQEAEAFCNMARNVFHIPPEHAAYPEEARKNMRRVILEMGYPLWTLAYSVRGTSDPPHADAMARATRAASDALAYDRDELSDQELRNVVNALRPVRAELPRLLSRDRMEAGMREFLVLHAPKLPDLMTAVKLGMPEIMARLRALLAEDVYLWREERVKEKLPELVRELDLTDALNGLLGVVKRDLDEARAHFRTVWFRGKLPLACFKEGQAPELAALVEYVRELIYRSDGTIAENRAEDIRRHRTELVSLFGRGAQTAGLLAQRVTGEVLSESEVAQLYAELPDLSDAPEDRVEREIVAVLSRQARQKKLTDLRQQWQSLTGSDSPGHWSERMRTPIQWILDGEAYREFIARFAALHQLSEHELDQASAYLRDHEEQLSVLRDGQYVLDRFVETAASEYAELVRQANAATALRDFVYDAMGGNAYQWPMRSHEVQRAVRQWVVQNYRDTVHPQIVAAVEVMSADDVKRLVRDVVADDALFGIRLLAAIGTGRTTRRGKG